MIKYLPERLREMRKKRHISQKDVAKLLNVSPSLISSYELGERTPSVDMLLSLSYLYKCSTDYLLGRTSSNVQKEELDIEGLSAPELKVLKDLIVIMKKK